MIPFSDEELMPAVKKSLEKIRPQLALDGGDIELVEVKDGKVYVRLKGACGSCPASTMTLQHIVQKQLRYDIHPEIEVIKV